MLLILPSGCDHKIGTRTEPSSLDMTPGPCTVRTFGTAGRVGLAELNFFFFFLGQCTVRDPQVHCSSGLAWLGNRYNVWSTSQEDALASD